MNYTDKFRIRPRSTPNLKDIDPSFTDKHKSHKQALEDIEHYQQRLRELQEMLYVEQRRSVLIILQALDTAGKDGTINHVLGAMNPQSCRVAGFREPSREEAAHDFLWRVHHAAPANGEVVIFNRSHYEDVLIVRVHSLVPGKVLKRRYDLINDFEQTMIEHGTHILKFYLHISKDEQLKRFKARLDDPTKQWKISEADYKERAYWDKYIEAYEKVFKECNSSESPWFVIPANHKWFRNLAVARIVVEHLEAMKMTYPKPKVDLAHIRREYHAEKQ